MKMIAVTKLGRIAPIKLFDDWWECGKWCDEFINKKNGHDPTLYRIEKVTGIKKHLHRFLQICKYRTINKEQ